MRIGTILFTGLYTCSFFLTISFLSNAQQGEQWFPIGPAPVQDGQTYITNSRVDVSGRATVIAVNPENPADVWMGSANGGVWNSTNAAQPAMSWKPMTDFMPSLAIGAIALTNCNSVRCNTIYVGTGENNIRRDTYYGRGLYRLQWIGGEFPGYARIVVGTTDEFFGYGAINDIVVDEGVIYVSVSEGRTSSAHQITVVAPPPPSGYGVFRSDDDGDTWEKIEGSDDWLPTDMELIGGVLYAGFMEQGNGLTGRGIFRLNPATNTWCPLNPGNVPGAGCPAIIANLPDAGTFDHVELAAAPSNPEIIYAVFGQCPSVTVTRCTPLLFRTVDGGGSWDQVNFYQLRYL